MRFSLPKLADILILFGCVLLVSILLTREWNSYRGKQKHDVRLAQLTGKRVAQPDGQYEAMVILQLSPDCIYCSKSIPFYRDLKDLADRSRERLLLAAQFPDPEAGKIFLGTNELRGIADLGPPPTVLSTGLVPTVVLADQTGRVVKAWTGYLDASRQREVLSALETLCPACDKIPMPDAATIP